MIEFNRLHLLKYIFSSCKFSFKLILRRFREVCMCMFDFHSRVFYYHIPTTLTFRSRTIKIAIRCNEHDFVVGVYIYPLATEIQFEIITLYTM